MKVSTDSCLFGAWFAQQNITAGTILDIGAGSGLLTLMLAQKNPAPFHAIEKDYSSFTQLQQNINESPWNARVKTFHADAITFEFPTRYDFIISNPPFYENELKSPNDKKNAAMHDTSLTLAALLSIISDNLTPSGSFGILLPYYRKDYFKNIAMQAGFGVIEELEVKQTPNHAPFRSILHFGKSKFAEYTPKELTIKGDSNDYTPEFITLLKDYYLAF